MEHICTKNYGNTNSGEWTSDNIIEDLDNKRSGNTGFTSDQSHETEPFY